MPLKQEIKGYTMLIIKLDMNIISNFQQVSKQTEF